MDGSLAALFALVASADLAFGGCGASDRSCGAEPEGRLAVQAGELLHQGGREGMEFYLLNQLPRDLGPVQPVIGLSFSEQGDAWVGAGLQWTKPLTARSYVQLSLLPGLYARRDGPDLGHAIEFRSSAGVGYEFAGGQRVSLHYDHRSNADLSDPNPGLESLGIRVSIPY